MRFFLLVLGACAILHIATEAPLALAGGPRVIRVGGGSDSRTRPLKLSKKLAAAMRRFGFHFLQDGQQAMDFTLRDLHGDDFQLMSRQGSWVLLNFFATWCGPCMHEMPALESLSRVGACLQVVGVATGRSENPRGVAAQLGVDFPLLWDSDDVVGNTWAVHRFPTTYLIDPKGYVQAVAVGSRSWEQMGQAVGALPGCDRRLRR